MKNKILIALLGLFLLCCSGRNNKTSDSGGSLRQERVGEFVYNVKDTVSCLYISYRECTECLDAWVDSGIVYMPDSVMRKIKELYGKGGAGFIPNGHDLYLSGRDRIAETLFGDTSNFMQHWHDRFFIRGKAIDVRGYGIVFRVDSYEKLDAK